MGKKYELEADNPPPEIKQIQCSELCNFGPFLEEGYQWVANLKLWFLSHYSINWNKFGPYNEAFILTFWLCQLTTNHT